MQDPIFQLLGVSHQTLFWVMLFWVVVFITLLGNTEIIALPAGVMSIVSALIIGKIGVLSAILLGAVSLALGGYLLARWAARVPVRFQPRPVPTASSAQVPTTLYHGTPTLAAARDILQNNRWRVNPHNPHGIYMSINFNEASGYAGSTGAVVMVTIALPPGSIVDRASCPGNGDHALAMGYRLVRMNTIYVALVPQNSASQRYFRVTGIIPVRILDRQQNPIY